MESRLASVAVLTLILIAAGCGQTETGTHEELAAETVADGHAYGEELALTDGVTIAELLADPAAFEGQSVHVEGMITDVCPKRGCWFEMAGENAGEKLRFKVEDGVMVFPVNAKGKYAVAEGTVVVDQLTLEETVEHLAHQAEEQGTEFDPASVTEPLRIVRLDGSGAVIRDAR
jgi:hypothetical protein